MGGGTAKRVRPFVLSVLMMGMAAMPVDAQSPAAGPGPAASGGPVYVVTYFEVALAASDAVARILKQHAAETAKAASNIESIALREVGRGNRFAFFEGWRDKEARDAQAQS